MGRPKEVPAGRQSASAIRPAVEVAGRPCVAYNESDTRALWRPWTKASGIRETGRGGTARWCLRALCVAVASLLLAGAVAEAAGRFDHGLLWQVSRAGVKASHIFGTVHLPDVRLLPLPDPVLEAFAKARSFGLEHHPDEQAGLRFFEGGQFEDGRRLDQMIGDASFRRLAPLSCHRHRRRAAG